MNIADYIQMSLAVIAGVGAILAFISILQTNRQINLQQKQWQHMNIPIFRVIKTADFRDCVVIVIENPNKVYHKISKVSFSEENVRKSVSFNGSIKVTDGKTKEKTTYEGLTINLYPKDEDYYVGSLQIQGEDSIGNKFSVNIPNIKIENYALINKYDLTNIYLTNN